MVCILLRMFPALMQNCQISMYGIAPGFPYKGRRPGQAKREGEKDMTPKEVLQFAQENGAKMVDLKFVDLPGSWQHFSIPVRELREETFVEGVPLTAPISRVSRPLTTAVFLSSLIPPPLS